MACFICIPELLFQVPNYGIVSLENTHPRGEGRDGHGHTGLQAPWPGWSTCSPAACAPLGAAIRSWSWRGASRHDGHAPRLPPVGSPHLPVGRWPLAVGRCHWPLGVGRRPNCPSSAIASRRQGPGRARSRFVSHWERWATCDGARHQLNFIVII